MKIVIDIPRNEVRCLLVAIQHQAHDMAMGAAQERKRYGGDTDLARTWEGHAEHLQRIKADIKRQARIK